MKNLYHLFVTRYKLQVTSYKLHIARFKRFTSHLLPLTSYLFLLFLFLPFFALAQNEAEVTDVVFSCGTVTVTYNLEVCGSVDSVTLYYSPDKCGWFSAKTEEDVQPGNGKTIVWDATATPGASFGKFYYKVGYFFNSNAPTCFQLGGVMVNGKCWAQYNLNEIGEIYENHAYSTGNYSAALYQWGRLADGHAKRNSTITTTLSPTDDPGHNNFIVNPTQPWNWLTTPGNDFLWNSGTETCPVKTNLDPCPEHWRVPTRTELDGLFSKIIGGSGSLATYATGIVGRWFGDGGMLSLFLPAAGNRSNSDGSLNMAGLVGYYWSSTPNGTNAYIWRFNSGDFYINTNSRATGFSVRCVAEN